MQQSLGDRSDVLISFSCDRLGDLLSAGIKARRWHTLLRGQQFRCELSIYQHVVKEVAGIEGGTAQRGCFVPVPCNVERTDEEGAPAPRDVAWRH